MASPNPSGHEREEDGAEGEYDVPHEDSENRPTNPCVCEDVLVVLKADNDSPTRFDGCAITRDK